MIIRFAAIALISILVSAAQSWACDADQAHYAQRASAPQGYPDHYAAIVRAAEDEGQLVIYGATDASAMAPLIADFCKVYPRIRVTYEDLNTTILFHRFIAEARLGDHNADVLFSSAMDQMVSLVVQGLAMTYVSPEKAQLPDWANWQDQAFGVTYEPVLIAYNKDLIKSDEVPRTRADLIRMLEADPERFSGKVTAYDIEKSGIGFLLAAQDEAASQDFWRLAKALRKVKTKFALTTAGMAEQVGSGSALIGYNLLGGYVLTHRETQPSLGYVLPQDYTLVISRVMVVSKTAPHPNAAKLWIDYLLSRRGQTILADRSRLFAIRGDVDGENTATALRKRLGATERPIAIGIGLVEHLNRGRYRDFILRWVAAAKP